ncbi:hypothetical protein JOL62DRAFT_615999 [Phyllosticta paracitricarpa]|uniref:Uncharacterized protein n=2 Tax=Phyllosticta TaxID=121621 RepID=A0ABR1LRS8_9PEZI
MFLILPIKGMRVELLDFDTGDPSFPVPAAGSAQHIKQLRIHLDTTSRALMPVPRVPPTRLLDDMPGYLMLCLKSLCRVHHLELFVAATDPGLELALNDFCATVNQGDAESLEIDASSTYSSGQTGGFDRWDCYPTTADDLGGTAFWNPYKDDRPPPYTDDVDANPSPKRKASRSCSPPEQGRSPSRKARLGNEDAHDNNEDATEVDSSSELDAWVERVQNGGLPPSAQPPAHLYPQQKFWQAIDSPWPTIPRPSVDHSVRAPSSSRNSATAKWRTELKKPDAMFLDMILLLKRAVERDPDAHNKYFDDFCSLGVFARKAVEAQVEATTPEVDFHTDNFTGTRERLMRTMITDAVAATAKDPPTNVPLPKNPVDQCEHLRKWINERMQANADVDLYNELIAMHQAAVRLRNECALQDALQRPQVAAEDDELWWDFEFTRAACVATAFFKFAESDDFF